MKSTADRIIAFLRPNRSLITPAPHAPIAQPNSAQAAAQPFIPSSSMNRFWRNPIAPEMTAVSYPNSSPPNAATNVRRST